MLGLVRYLARSAPQKTWGIGGRPLWDAAPGISKGHVFVLFIHSQSAAGRRVNEDNGALHYQGNSSCFTRGAGPRAGRECASAVGARDKRHQDKCFARLCWVAVDSQAQRLAKRRRLACSRGTAVHPPFALRPAERFASGRYVRQLISGAHLHPLPPPKSLPLLLAVIVFALGRAHP